MTAATWTSLDSGQQRAFARPQPARPSNPTTIGPITTPLRKTFSSTILLDVTRSLRRVRHPVPSGIDRVESAYLRWAVARGNVWLLAAIADRQYLLPPQHSGAFARLLKEGAGVLDLRARLRPWRSQPVRQAESALRRLAVCGVSVRRFGVCLAQYVPGPAFYLNVGQTNLSRGVMVEIRAAGIRPIVMLHDTIPLDLPHTVRAGTVESFEQRLRAASGADRLLFNSLDTARRVGRALHDRGVGTPAGQVLPLGAGLPAPATRTVPAKPFFVILGTIEPRKNHALILRIWERFDREPSRTKAPILHIVGRRGWAGREVLATLDHAEMMGRCVFEHGHMSDADLARLLRGARALLMPSLAEGYGLPVAEALSLGVPVIASDLPALREVAGNVADWLDPCDEPAWRQAIRDYAEADHPRRIAQLRRLKGWSSPGWQRHFAELESLLKRVMASNGPAR